MAAYAANIETETLYNGNYRKVLHTTPQMQLVVMKLRPLESVPMEVHPHTTQFLRIEQGQATVIVDGNMYLLGDGDVIIIPAGTAHVIINEGVEDLAFYTIYSPPEHSS